MQQASRFNTVSPIRQRVLDCAVLISLLLVGWVYTFGIQQVIDIGLYDESNYLHGGLLIPKGIPSAQNAPLYSLWYYMLSFIRPDTVQLYFLNYKLMTVLPSLALFIALRSFSVSRVVSLVLSFWLLFSTANFPTEPKVSHFAVLVLLSGFFLASFARGKTLQTSVLAITALLSSYIRPEYFLAFVCLTILLAILTLLDFRRTQSLKGAIPMLTTLLPCAVVILLLGSPMGSGNRSMVAFGQHYSLNWVKWQNDTRNPWTNWKTIVSKDFGDVSSPSQALLANPSAFAHHVLQNLRAFPHELKSMFFSTYPLSSPARIALKFGILVLAIAGLVRLRRETLSVLRRRIRDNWAFLWFRLTLLLFAILPVGISIVVIYPRNHYLYIFGILLTSGLVIFIFRNTDDNKEPSDYSSIALLCVAVLLVARPLSNSLPAAPQPNLKTIEFLRDLHLKVPVNILEAEGGYGIYIGENYHRIAEYEKDVPFAEFMTKKKLDMIVVSPLLSQDVRFHDDPQWHSFTNAPEAFGFSRRAIPDVDNRILFLRREMQSEE